MYIILSHTIYNITQFLCSFKGINKIFLVTFNSKIYNKYYTFYNKSHIISQNNSWKVLFFGTDEFAVESLKILYNK